MQELLNTFGLNVDLLVAQVINFVVVLLVLWYFLYRPIMNLIDERREKIEKGLADSEKAKKELREADKDRIEILQKANEDAERIVAESKTYADEQKNEILADAREKSDATLEEARQKGEETRKQFLQNSKEEVARMSVLAAESVLREKIESDAQSSQS